MVSIPTAPFTEDQFNMCVDCIESLYRLSVRTRSPQTANVLAFISTDAALEHLGVEGMKHKRRVMRIKYYLWFIILHWL